MQYSRVEICGVDTSKIKVLKEAEKIELLKKIKENDDKKARQKLIEGNLRLVLSVVQFQNNSCLAYCVLCFCSLCMEGY